MIELKHLGPALKILRRRSDLMQKHISVETGMSRSQISRYEKGRDIPNLVTLTKYLNTVGADFGDLHRALLKVDTGGSSSQHSLTELPFRDLMRPMIEEALGAAAGEDLVNRVADKLRERLSVGHPWVGW